MIRGTTPVIIYRFNENQVSDFTEAFLTIKQGSNVIEKDLSSAVLLAEENQIGWTLTQQETLSLLSEDRVEVQIRYKIGSVAGASKIKKLPVSAILKEGVI